jgi:hypothetical protein
MQSTDRDRVLVTDLAPNYALLGKANVVRLARSRAADNARLSGDEFAVFLIAQVDSLRCDATAASFWFKRQDDWSRHQGLLRLQKTCSLAVAERASPTEPPGSSTEACIDWTDASLFLKRRILTIDLRPAGYSGSGSRADPEGIGSDH